MKMYEGLKTGEEDPLFGARQEITGADVPAAPKDSLFFVEKDRSTIHQFRWDNPDR